MVLNKTKEMGKCFICKRPLTKNKPIIMAVDNETICPTTNLAQGVPVHIDCLRLQVMRAGNEAIIYHKI
jgi:hypothetical protein